MPGILKLSLFAVLITVSFAVESFAFTFENKLFWVDTGTEAGQGKIQRADMDGNSIIDLKTDMYLNGGLAIEQSSGQMYWIDTRPDLENIYYEGELVEQLALSGIYKGDIDGLDESLVIRESLWEEESFLELAINQTTGQLLLSGYSGISWLYGNNFNGRCGMGCNDIAIDEVNNNAYTSTFTGSYPYGGPGTLYIADLDGSDNQEITDFGTGFGVAYINGMAVDNLNGQLYLSVMLFDGYPFIGRANLDGSGLEVVIPQTVASDLVLDVDAGKMYWTSGRDGEGKISSANMDGTGEIVDLVTGLTNPGDLAIAPIRIPCIAGDINCDGTVGLLDLDILGANWGTTGVTWPEGDLNDSGSVTLLDLDILGANWGNTASTPEPAGATILLLASAAVVSRRK